MLGLRSGIYLFSIALGLLLLSFTSCSPQEKKLQKMVDSTTIVTYTKERGRGTKKPIYTLEILESKTLKYTGILNVPVVGERIIPIETADYEKIVQALKTANFEEFESVYKGKMRDLPLTSITYQGHKVTYQDEVCPKKLGGLAEWIEGLIDVEGLE